MTNDLAAEFVLFQLTYFLSIHPRTKDKDGSLEDLCILWESLWC